MIDPTLGFAIATAEGLDTEDSFSLSSDSTHEGMVNLDLLDQCPPIPCYQMASRSSLPTSNSFLAHRPERLQETMHNFRRKCDNTTERPKVHFCSFDDCFSVEILRQVVRSALVDSITRLPVSLPSTFSNYESESVQNSCSAEKVALKKQLAKNWKLFALKGKYW